MKAIDIIFMVLMAALGGLEATGLVLLIGGPLAILAIVPVCFLTGSIGGYLWSKHVVIPRLENT